MPFGSSERVRTITGTGLKKCKPTTLLALALPSGSLAVLPCGIVEAAIFVRLIEDVFEARMVVGDNSEESVRKIASLIAKFSATACMRVEMSVLTPR